MEGKTDPNSFQMGTMNVFHEIKATKGEVITTFTVMYLPENMEKLYPRNLYAFKVRYYSQK